MAKSSKVYVLTPEDITVLGAARENANNFTAYYIRTPDRPVEDGWRFDAVMDKPWQLDFCHASQTDLVVIGGMGSGKTIGSVMAMLYWACLTPDFKGMHMAPTGSQAKMGYDILMPWIRGSILEERLIWNNITKPYPKIEIRYRFPDHQDPKTGKIARGREVYSSIEFMSSADNADRILTWEGDWVNHDQAEQIDDMGETEINLGTRVRGKINHRARLGRVSWIANSDDNPELWWRYDQAAKHPDTNASWLISSYDNRALSDKDIASFERRLGYDKEKIAQHMLGKRPIPQGEEFKAELMEMVFDESIDYTMAAALSDGLPGYECIRGERTDIEYWQMPYESGRLYVVCGDPGQGTAPARNAPVVFVLDITEYPEGPARLRAFWWGNGSGKYEPWQNRMLGWISEYHAVAAGYDSTGGQKLHSETTFGQLTNVQPIDMAGVRKNLFMNALKMIFGKQRIKLPRIAGIVTQFGKYRLPDTKISQDIVAAFFVFSGLMWALGIDDSLVGESESRELPLDTMLARGDRYARTPGLADRHERSYHRPAR